MFADLDLQTRYHTTGSPDPLTGFYVPEDQRLDLQ